MLKHKGGYECFIFLGWRDFKLWGFLFRFFRALDWGLMFFIWFLYCRVILCLFRKMFIKELFLLFIKDSVLTKELFKSLVGIFQRELELQHAIIMASFVVVRQYIIGFRNVIELLFSKGSINFMFVRMPLGSKFLVGVFNVKCWSIIGNTKDLVVVFELAHFLFFL